MLTLVGVPKPCDGAFYIIQRNAIQSWTLLDNNCEVLLLGNDAGVASLSAELSVRHISDIARNKFGTPMLNSIWEIARREAQNDFIAFVNSDILLMADFYHAFKRLTALMPWFLMVGQRRDVDINEPINFDERWQNRLRQLAIKVGDLYAGIDYFVYPKSLWLEVPPFALGRLHWDNWPLYAARLRRAPVIDTTPVVLAVHQNHQYTPGTLGGNESRINRELVGDARMFTTTEATHVLKEHGLYPRCRSCEPICCCRW